MTEASVDTVAIWKSPICQISHTECRYLIFIVLQIRDGKPDPCPGLARFLSH